MGEERTKGNFEDGVMGVRNGLEVYLESAVVSSMGDVAGW